jgi:membrane-bound serine protease (ClpP class)
MQLRMKFLFTSLAALLFLQTAPAAYSQEQVVIIPIDNVITKTTLYMVRKGVQKAIDNKAAAIIFLMDTPGGQLDATEEIVNNIIDIPIPTYTLVDRDAISAGAIIALATDHIYMVPGSKIGDALPMMGGPMGYQEMDERAIKKVTAPVDAMMRSIAERKNRNVDVARAMIRHDLEVKIGDEIIWEPGLALTLTDTEAARSYGDPPTPLLSEGTVKDLDELLAKLDLAQAEKVELEVNWAEQSAKFISNLSPFLIMLGLIGLFIEMNSPGISWAGLMAAFCFALFFLGHYVAGLAGSEEIILFVLGVILIGVELFVIPGFGIAGISGIALVTGSLFMAMVQRYPGIEKEFIPRLSDFSDLHGPMMALSTAIIGTGIGIGLAGKFLPKSRGFNRRMVLVAATDKADGYVAARDESSLLGKTGMTTSDLRPGGRVDIDGRPVDVVSEGDYIEAGTPVQVSRIEGARIVVLPHQPEPGASEK